MLPVLERPLEKWRDTAATNRRRARERANELGLTTKRADAWEEHAMPPPWLVNPVGYLVLGIDDGPSRPSFCGNIYLKRKLFPKSPAAKVIAPERRFETTLTRQHMLPWAETGRFDTLADVIADCEERLRRHHVPHGKQTRCPLKQAVVWRSPLLARIDLRDIVKQRRQGD